MTRRMFLGAMGSLFAAAAFNPIKLTDKFQEAQAALDENPFVIAARIEIDKCIKHLTERINSYVGIAI